MSQSNDASASKCQFGVVEAYYGRSWSTADRRRCLGAFAEMGIGNYLYAPKADARLRKDWQLRWTDSELTELSETFACARQVGVEAGAGLSPLGLERLDSAAIREALTGKIEQINSLGGSRLGIFFDDMPSAGKAMADCQLAIIDFIAERSNASQILVCPSYYTTDPLLEKLFGARPVNYWEILGAGMDRRLDFFWTGEQVCSRSYSQANLTFIAEQFRRLPTLWDNYPVNDGEKSSRFLNLLPFEREDWLGDYLSGHYANPMNQPQLSLLPLSTLSCAGRSADVRQQRWLRNIEQRCPELKELLLRDAAVFQQQGLDAMGDSALRSLLDEYARYDSVFAAEIYAWLSGEYAFDPACLTG